MSWLSKKWDELSAQVNMRDGGKTASTVRASRNQPAPAQTTRGNNTSGLSVGVARPQGNVVVDQPQHRQAPPMRVAQPIPTPAIRVGNERIMQSPDLTNKPLYNPVQAEELRKQVNNTDRFRIFDANTASDRLKRVTSGQPELYRDQQKENGYRRAPNNIGQAVTGQAAANVNTLASRLIETPETLRGSLASLTGNQDALSASLARQKQWQDNLYGNPKSGLLGAGTIYDSPEESRNLGVAETAKRTAGGQMEAASLALGGPALGNVAKQGFKKGVQYLGSREGRRNAGHLSAGGFSGTAGFDIAQNENTSPASAMTAGAVGAVVAPLGGALLGAAGVASRPLARATTKLVTSTGSNVSRATTNLVKKPLMADENGSIQIGPDGKKFVKVDTDQHLFDNVPPARHPEIARKYLNENLKGKSISTNGGEIQIGRSGIGKFTSPSKLDEATNSAKMRLAPEFRNVGAVSKKVGNSPDRGGKHGSLAKDGFDYHNFEFEVGGNKFRGTVNVGVNGKAQNFYDIHPIKKSPVASRHSLNTDDFIPLGFSNNRGTVSPNGAPTPNIPNNTRPVNPIKGFEKLKDNQDGFAKIPFESDLETAGLKPKSRKGLGQTAPRQEITNPKTPKQQQLEKSLQKSSEQNTSLSQRSSHQSASDNLETNPIVGQGSAMPQIQQSIAPSYVPKIQQKTPVVKDVRRAISGSDKSTYKLRESFNESENVPDDLKDVLGAFGNTRTVRPNKELWADAQQRVGTDPASAMKYFTENADDDAVATGYALINRFMKNGQSKEAGEIAMTMAERALQSGRTTQAYALMKRLTPEGSVQYVENKVARYANQHPNAKLNWNDEVRTGLYKMAEDVNKLPEGRERNLLIGKMQETVDNIFPSGILDKAVTTWKAGLLTSLRTHERNILGNTINTVTEQASTIPGSVVDRIMSLRTGKRTLVASTGKGMGEGTRKGAQIAKDQILTGVDVTNSNLKYNINHITWNDNKVEQTLKKFTETVFRPLGAEDKLFKESARQNSFYNQALAEAKTKGLKGADKDALVKKLVDSPTAKMRDLADDDAGRATFSHDNFLGDIIREGKGAVKRSSRKGANVASAGLDVLMPFTQIPSGVASQLYAYSPAKLMKSSYDIGKVLVTGSDELQRQAAQGFGRSVVGTSLLGAGAYFGAKGQMVGQPRDDAEKAQWEAQGIKPNSVKVGDRWYQLSSIGPQNLLVLAGAQMEQDKKAGEDAWGNLAANIGKNFKEQTFLKGMSSALDAVGDPARYADAYLQQQATSVIPNIVKDVARAVDPNERQTSTLADKAKAAIPGLSKSLPERRDSYGQTIKNSGVLEMVDLFNSSKQKDNKAAQFVESLRNDTGEKVHIPAKAPKSVVINGESRKLTAKEQSDYQEYIGKYSQQVIDKARNDPGFLKLPKEEQVKLIDSVLKEINAHAKADLFGNKQPKKEITDILDATKPKPTKKPKAKKTAKKKTAKGGGKKGGSKKGKGKGGGKGGAKKGKFDYTKDLFGSTVTSGSVSKSLRQILEKAMQGK